jgi:CheY-like chemotaxis protein
VEQLLNILAVDDEPGVTTALTLALESPRRRLSSACDGEDALAKMTQPPSYDVVITDNNMPRWAYLELNVDRLLEKPFDLQSLRRAIDGLEKAA